RWRGGRPPRRREARGRTCRALLPPNPAVIGARSASVAPFVIQATPSARGGVARRTARIALHFGACPFSPERRSAMCGIVGIYSPTGAVSSQELERATRRLIHRGPDGQRTWLDPGHRVGLGHARLSIIDLATGDQPIASEDERVNIVVNGEFYD